jgi:hypothetical protein
MPVLNAGGGKNRGRVRQHGYASSAPAFAFALCMKYNRLSTGMNSKWHRLAAAAKAARFALPTSSISPKAYAVSIGEKRAFASCMVIQPGSSMGSLSSEADSKTLLLPSSLRAGGGRVSPPENRDLKLFNRPMATPLSAVISLRQMIGP